MKVGHVMEKSKLAIFVGAIIVALGMIFGSTAAQAATATEPEFLSKQGITTEQCLSGNMPEVYKKNVRIIHTCEWENRYWDDRLGADRERGGHVFWNNKTDICISKESTRELVSCEGEGMRWNELDPNVAGPGQAEIIEPAKQTKP